MLGIGTVEIPTKRSPNLSGVASHGTLILHEVLHVPDSICNFIGKPLFREGEYKVLVSSSSKSNGTIKNRQGNNVAYFDPKSPLFAIKIRGKPTGPKLGPHALKRDVIYVLACRWDRAQRRKWEEYKNKIVEDFVRKTGLATPAYTSASTIGKYSPYTPEEREFLKKNWGGEYKFLLQHGLKIHNEDDRTEGRSILRALMEEDASDEDFGGDFGEDFEDEEFDFEGHQADYNFSSQQLDWIEQHYGNSETFMLSYGLKFYDDDDVEEAKSIANAMMANDEYVVF